MGPKQKIVILSGAGVSAESGLKTFRDSDGLWENYRVEEVATPEAWIADPAMVLEFYNQRRKQVIEASPNAAHIAIAELERIFDVHVVTQNIDDLHERAGSSDVLHLHGEVMLARGENSRYHETVPVHGGVITMGEKATDGSQLRPHVVWFGEAVPMLEKADRIVGTADILIVVGTSLNVYPAASLIHSAPQHAVRFLVDPSDVLSDGAYGFKVIKEKASSGIPKLASELMSSIAD